MEERREKICREKCCVKCDYEWKFVWNIYTVSMVMVTRQPRSYYKQKGRMEHRRNQSRNESKILGILTMPIAYTHCFWVCFFLQFSLALLFLSYVAIFYFSFYLAMSANIGRLGRISITFHLFYVCVCCCCCDLPLQKQFILSSGYFQRMKDESN